jgi:hypothetical protein
VRHNITLTITSLLSILLMSFHLTQDVLHGADDPKGIKVAVLILLVWMCGTVMLAGRGWGYVITLLGGLFAAGMPVLHTMGASPVRWGFFFVWTLYALGVTGALAAILSVIGMWKLRSKRQAAAPASSSP